MKTIYIIACLLLLSTVSCTTDETETLLPSNRQTIKEIRDIGDVPALLKGTWMWTQTSGGFAGSTETPASTGNTKELVFNGNHTYRLSVNGITTSQGTFTMGTRYCIHYGYNKPLIDFSDPNMEDQTIEFLYPWELMLSDDYFDGFASRYVK